MIPTAAETQFRQLHLSQLRLSSTPAQKERRAHFDKDALAELAESIGTVGMLQPIVVRPLTDGPTAGGFGYEIIAGERRYLAAKQAKLETVPASVRALTDEQVIEVQLVENLQRADVHPMAEAEGYESLHRLGRTVDEIADKVGKSKGYVYARMKLLALVPEVRAAFYEGKISASIALLVARLDQPKDQQKAIKQILSGSWRQDGAMSFREASDYLRRDFMLRLRDAIFPVKDAELVAAAGPCTTCPKRSGNNPDLFGDIEDADVCTDPACFNLKKATYLKLQEVQASRAGLPLITDKAAAKIHTTYSSELQNGFQHCSAKIPDDPKKRTYNQVLGKTAAAMLQDPRTGRFSKVFDLKDDAAVEALKAAGVKVKPPQDASSNLKAGKTDKEWKEQARRNEIYVGRLLRAVYEATPQQLGLDELAIIARLVLYSDVTPDDLIALSLAKDKNGTDKALYGPRAAHTLLNLVAEPDRLRLLYSLTLAADGDRSYLESQAKRLGVNYKAIRKAVNAEEDAAAKAAAKAAGPAKKKGKKSAKAKAA